MNITRLLKQNKTLCVAFSEEEKAEFSKKTFCPRLFCSGKFFFAGNHSSGQNGFNPNRFCLRNFVFPTGGKA